MSTVFVFGTSNSILRPGYMDHVTAALSAHGIGCRNQSVGNATSVMGLMRLCQIMDQISPGDVVVWEYPILDILLHDFYGITDIQSAYRIAWQSIAERQAHIVVVHINPRHAILDGHDGEIAKQILSDALSKSLGWIAMRDVMSANGITEPRAQAEHYGGENGHILPDSPVLPAFANAICDEILSRVGKQFAALGDAWRLPAWVWCDGPSLPAEPEPEILEFSNHLTSVRALQMRPDNSVYLLPTPASRVIALGLVTTHRSGAVWCGHNCCDPASARLSVRDGHPFLLQASRLPCVRQQVTSLQAAPPHAMRRSIWADATQARLIGEDDAAPVAIFGALIEPHP